MFWPFTHLAVERRVAPSTLAQAPADLLAPDAGMQELNGLGAAQPGPQLARAVLPLHRGRRMQRDRRAGPASLLAPGSRHSGTCQRPRGGAGRSIGSCETGFYASSLAGTFESARTTPEPAKMGLS